MFGCRKGLSGGTLTMSGRLSVLLIMEKNGKRKRGLTMGEG